MNIVAPFSLKSTCLTPQYDLNEKGCFEKEWLPVLINRP